MTAKIDITDLIALLTGLRKEAFPFEKHIALLTFATWLQYPTDQAVLRHAQIVSAAACYIDSGGKHNPLVTVENLSFALLDSPLTRPFVDIPNSSVTLSTAITDIASFLLCCPSDRKPSLNKALFFVESGGFDYPDMRDEKIDDSVSSATLKVAWRERACTGPFLWSLAICGLGQLYEMLPDESTAYKRADKLLKRPNKLIEFFGISRFVQERLISTVDQQSRRRFSVKFPKRLEPIECHFNPLDQRQLDILARYRAPAPSY